jgi:hypothetical protein
MTGLEAILFLHVPARDSVGLQRESAMAWVKLAVLSAVLLLSGTAARADVSISAEPTSNMSCVSGVCTATAQKAVLNVSDLANMLASGNVAVKTGSLAKDIDVDQPLQWTSTARLTLDAQQSVTMKKQITIAGQGALTITTNDGGKNGEFIIVPEHGSVQFWDLSSSLIIDGQSYTLVDDVKTLASDIAVNPSGAYALAQNYDASSDGTYSASPIDITFKGELEGLGNTISHLTIKFQGGIDVGLFRSVGSKSRVEDVRVANAELDGTVGASWGGTGLLAGSSYGQVKNSIASGSIRLPGGENELAGGLVGGNFGTISSCSTEVSIRMDGDGSAGGLAAFNEGTIERSRSSGHLLEWAGNGPGGLVGTNRGSIINSYSFARVVLRTAEYYGELVGENDAPGTIFDSYAAGLVGTTRKDEGVPGGIVGFDATEAGSISNTYWDLDTGVANASAGAGNVKNDPGITGLTTAQLQAGLPAGFDPKIWGSNPNINNGYPYLLANLPR